MRSGTCFASDHHSASVPWPASPSAAPGEEISMKTRADLLLRDALAGQLVAATNGDVVARERLESLWTWSQGSALDLPTQRCLGELRTESDEAIFDAQLALTPRFAPLEPYVRDRALRFRTALGWLGEPRPDRYLEAARAAWDAGLFFEVHELLEPHWLRATGPERPALQGLIMAGAALHHLTTANLAGARGLLGDAARHIAQCPRVGERDLASFGAELAKLGEQIASGAVRRPEDVKDLPHF